MVVYTWSPANIRGLWVQGQPCYILRPCHKSLSQERCEESLPGDTQTVLMVLCARFTGGAEPVECDHVVDRIY